MEELSITGAHIAPGEYQKISVNVARLPSHTDIDLVMHVYRAHDPGPTVLFSGGLHGDEINGIEIVRRIIDQGLNKPKIGTVIAIPIINIYGFINFSRYVPDGKDINRSFPGSSTGSLASRIAHFIDREILPVIDLGIDFHTGGDNRTNFPQIRYDFSETDIRDLASATNAPFIINSPLISHSLRSVAYQKKKKILVYEGGESMRLNEIAVMEGITCAKNLLVHLRMYDDRRPQKSSLWLKESKWIRSGNSGVFHSLVEAGQIVAKGDILGVVTDPFGEYQKKIKANAHGYVIGLNNTPVVHQGDALIHLGFE